MGIGRRNISRGKIDTSAVPLDPDLSAEGDGVIGDENESLGNENDDAFNLFYRLF